MDNTDLINKLNEEWQTGLPVLLPPDKLLQKLSAFIDRLIQNDFQRLVHLLYKTDVSENKLRLLLKQNFHHDAAPVIAKLILERVQEKIDSAKRFSSKKNIPEEEKW